MFTLARCCLHPPNLHLLHSVRYIRATQMLWKLRSHTHYYDVLHITPHATHKQIKDAFYKLSKRYHPDSNKDASNSEKFHEIAEAYEILGNNLSRRKYDRGLLKPASEDTGVTDKSFRSKSYRTTHVHTGQSKEYNFDEYYRRHYGEQVLKEFAKKRRTSKQTGDSDAAGGVKRLQGQVWDETDPRRSRETFRFDHRIIVVAFLGLVWICSHFIHIFDRLEETTVEKPRKTK